MVWRTDGKLWSYKGNLVQFFPGGKGLLHVEISTTEWYRQLSVAAATAQCMVMSQGLQTWLLGSTNGMMQSS
jgi:hypothetical protein